MSDLPSNWGIKSPDQLLGSLRVAENGGDVTECADALEWMLRSGRLVDREAIDYEAAAGFWSDLASDVTDPDMEDFTYDLSKPGYAKKLTDLFLDAALGEET